MDVIDIPLTREQFDAFDAETIAMLCEATQSDLDEWISRLLVAWEADDQPAVLRARHSLKGVCGIYGAHALIALIAEPMREATARDRLMACVAKTIAAIHGVAAEGPQA